MNEPLPSVNAHCSQRAGCEIAPAAIAVACAPHEQS